ncbi:4-hydroxy-tetrahydrodipicolinate synthase [Desulfovibrio sulfodismutans]|uniref:4-hydroxy-tetrahydrodipicolinate synthase n=1 Tax=Desulfolutivibrio sulfodismutans TaxID=63561 RepID=A0A7K3NQQ4_9BACT|nr:4-hydroxy-tetrahydrodipicolinate synthase [Desulfolutivibrio sulfodismutans]NDY58417.1 4-hydroxy-tetrahydrodipicolinate synthase [Desulfolutivibrio sulfodismutans]QLA13970.1 4-hydroxy-tetrahydrodipicolinate synthase [Desulfolutivibrio sulfodismutans DSM 3696]
MEFRGAFTALVTPFSGGEVDEDRYRALIEWQIEQGIHGLVPCGTTGESATLSHAEHKRVIRICVEQVKGRIPVLAGAGSNNTREAVDLTREAKDAGADGALLITPYYNKPTQHGLVEHFAAIAAEVALPFVVYNVPSRTSVNVLPETLVKIKKRVPQVVGVKEATGNLTQISDIIEYCGPDFAVLSGDDFTVLPTLAVGGMGVISVVSNIVPGMMAGMCNAFFAGDLPKARELHYRMAPLCRGMFLETNPVPAKTALGWMGRLGFETRLPMVEMLPANQDKLRAILAAAGLV